jgi:energy-coupling factor transporter ATP-binding protein EcfA2
MTAVRVEELRTGYGATEVLRGVSFDVAPGESVALLGANGAGKTTLLRSLMAFQRPWGGRVTVTGRDTAGLDPEDLAGRVGYLFQRAEDQLFRRTVRSDVAFGPARLGWAPERTDHAVRDVLEELGLAAHVELHPYDLPVPWRRLVALAACLVTGPEVLLLDEPTALLDRSARAIVERVIRRRQAAGVAVIAVTHDLSFATEVLDRALVLEAGRVVADAPLADLLGAPGVPIPEPVAVVRRAGLTPLSLHREDLARVVAARCRSLQ